MEVRCRGVAQIRHHVTGVVHEIDAEDLDWDAVGGDERQMGPEIHYEATFDHPALGLLTWGLWEYPVGVENHSDTDVGSHELIKDFDYGLEHERPEPEEWLDYDTPDNPLMVFLDSYHQVGDLLADRGRDNGRDLVNRLVFSHLITALEAYLGDTLLNAVTADGAAMQRLIDKDEDLSKEKFTLAEIRKDPGLVERRAREHLRGVLFHNLAKVDALYELALGVRILGLTPRKADLFKAVMLRHDCVHRNGVDKDGQVLSVFTRAFIQDIAGLIRNFVGAIDNAVRTRTNAPS